MKIPMEYHELYTCQLPTALYNEVMKEVEKEVSTLLLTDQGKEDAIEQAGNEKIKNLTDLIKIEFVNEERKNMMSYYIRTATYGTNAPHIIDEEAMYQAEHGMNCLNADEFMYHCEAENMHDAEEQYLVEFSRMAFDYEAENIIHNQAKLSYRLRGESRGEHETHNNRIWETL